MEKEERFSESLYRNIRRWFLIVFRPYYVMVSLSQRKGNCKNCGCCRIKKNSCVYFNEEKHCTIWGSNIPFLCKISPFDEKDKSPFIKNNCGFYWDDNQHNKKD